MKNGCHRENIITSPMMLFGKMLSSMLLETTLKNLIFAIDASGTGGIPVVDGSEKYIAGVVAPIVSEGDIIGSVMMVSDKETMPVGEVEKKLCQSAAGFLGKHMED